MVGNKSQDWYDLLGLEEEPEAVNSLQCSRQRRGPRKT